MASSDPVEIRVQVDDDGGVQLNDVADVVLYFKHTRTDKMYAVIRYYTVLPGIGAHGSMHRKMMVPRIKTRDPGLYSTFSCVEVAEIAAHAHLIPDFDTPMDLDGVSKCYFWDLFV